MTARHEDHPAADDAADEGDADAHPAADADHADDEGDTAEVEALRRRVDDLERFTRRVAHELATPLTAAAGFARLLLDRGGHDAETHDGLRRIERSATSAAEVVRQRLAGAVPASPDHLVLRQLLQDAVATTCGDDTDVVWDVAPDLVVFGPPSGLQEVVGLLVRALALRLAHQQARASLRFTAAPLGPDIVAVTGVAPSAAPLAPATGEPGEDQADEPVRDAVRRLERLLPGLGGRSWVPAPTVAADQFSVLVHLPRGRSPGAGPVVAS